MKNFVILGFALFALNLSGQTLRYGIQAGFQENNNRWAGGMEEASGRFHQNPYTGLGFSFLCRYDPCEKMSFVSGLGLYTWGFDYSLYQRYNLRTGGSSLPYAHVDITSLEVPAMVYLNSRRDCSGARWVAGLGVSAVLNGAMSQTLHSDPANEANSNSGFSTSLTVPGGGRACLRLSAGRELFTKHKGVFHVEITGCISFKEAARAEVIYMDEGRSYRHEFSNTGSYAGFRVQFYFGRLSKGIAIKK